MINKNQVHSQLIAELKDMIAKYGTGRANPQEEQPEEQLDENDVHADADLEGNESGEHEEPDGDEACPTCGEQTLQDGTCPSCG